MALEVRREEFDHLTKEWEALLPRSWFDTVFLTPLWQRLWWEELGGGAGLLLAALREQGRLVAVVPLMESAGGISFLGDTDLWDYHDFIVAQGREEEVFPKLFAWLREQRWRSLDLRSLPQGSPTLEHLPSLARAAGYAVNVTQEDVAPGVALSGSWEEHLARLSKKDRHEVRRKFRRLEQAGRYGWYSWNGATPLAGALEQFLTLMRGSREDKAIFLTAERERFFRRMASELAQAGLLRLFFLQVDDTVVASALCFDYASRRLLYNSGYDVEYASLSVGLLLKALCLRDAIESGMAYFDFLRGSERYKYELGGTDVILYRLLVER